MSVSISPSGLSSMIRTLPELFANYRLEYLEKIVRMLIVIQPSIAPFRKGVSVEQHHSQKPESLLKQ